MFRKRPAKDTERSFRTPPPRASGRSNVFSYYGSRGDASEGYERTRMRSAEVTLDMREQTTRQWLRSIPVVLTGVVLVVCLGYNLFVSTNPRIILIGDVAEQALLQDREVYNAAVRRTLSHSVFNRSKLTFQTDKVRQSIEQEFPELESVRVSLPLMGIKPVIHIEPATPAVVLVASDGASSVLDGSGRVISMDVGRVPQNESIAVVNDRSGLETVVGAQLLPRSNIEFIQSFLYQMREKKHVVESLTLPAGVQELEVRLRGSAYVVRVSLREDARQQAGALIATIEYLRDARVQPKRYIDLRVGERIFYR